MAGDLDINERAVIEDVDQPAGVVLARETPGRTIHRYGRVSILAEPNQSTRPPVRGASELAYPVARAEVERAWGVTLTESLSRRGCAPAARRHRARTFPPPRRGSNAATRPA